jgi:hypothetical protein
MLARARQSLLLFVCLGIFSTTALSGFVVCKAEGGHTAIEPAHVPNECPEHDEENGTGNGGPCEDQSIGRDLVLRIEKLLPPGPSPLGAFSSVIDAVVTPPLLHAAFCCHSTSPPTLGGGPLERLCGVVLLI